MATIKIGASKRQFESRDNLSVCVCVSIRQGPVDLSLTTADCPISGGGGRREPNSAESKAFELWESLGLNGVNFQGGKLVAFFKQVRRVIG